MSARRRAARRSNQRTARRNTQKQVRRRAKRRERRQRAARARRPLFGIPGTRRRRPLAALLAIGGIAAIAHKIGQDSARRVEQHTGRTLHDLSDAELTAALNDLNIDVAADDDPDYLDELERLAGLRDQGVISAADFEAKKRQLLGL